MNQRSYYQARIAIHSVLAFLFGVAALIPGVDPTGRVVSGVLSGIMLAFLAYNVWRYKRASPDVPVYMITNLPDAPVAVRIAVLRRCRWWGFGASMIYIVMTAVDFYRLQSGTIESVNIMIPFNFVYSAFGTQATLVCLTAFSAGLFYGVDWLMRRVEREAQPPKSPLGAAEND